MHYSGRPEQDWWDPPLPRRVEHGVAVEGGEGDPLDDPDGDQRPPVQHPPRPHHLCHTRHCAALLAVLHFTYSHSLQGHRSQAGQAGLQGQHLKMEQFFRQLLGLGCGWMWCILREELFITSGEQCNAKHSCPPHIMFPRMMNSQLTCAGPVQAPYNQ